MALYRHGAGRESRLRPGDDERGTAGEMIPSDAPPRERVDEREWAVRYLSMALSTEDVDEKDDHVSLARQRLAADDPDAAGQSGRRTTPTEADEPS